MASEQMKDRIDLMIVHAINGDADKMLGARTNLFRDITKIEEHAQTGTATISKLRMANKRLFDRLAHGAPVVGTRWEDV